MDLYSTSTKEQNFYHCGCTLVFTRAGLVEFSRRASKLGKNSKQIILDYVLVIFDNIIGLAGIKEVNAFQEGKKP